MSGIQVGVVGDQSLVLVVRTGSVHCGADVDRPGVVRLMGQLPGYPHRTLARGLAALRQAWPLLSEEVREAVVPPAEPKKTVTEVAVDWSDASVQQIAATQPERLRMVGTTRLWSRTAGDEIGWRSEREKLRDAGFPAVSLSRPAAAADGTGETLDAAIGDRDLAAAPLEPTLSPDWGREEIERRWRLNGPIVRVSRLRNGKVSAVVNRFGPVTTVAYRDRSGAERVLADLSPSQLRQALALLEREGSVVVAQTERDRWHREAHPSPARAVARYLEVEATLPPVEQRRAAAKRLRALAGRPVPHALRYDLHAERAAAEYEDRSAPDDGADPDSPMVAEFTPYWGRN